MAFCTFEEMSTVRRSKSTMQSISLASNNRHLKLSLSRTFFSVYSLVPVNVVTNSFGISNRSISNFHYVELFSWSLQRFLGLFSIRYLQRFHFTHPNVERIHSKTLIKFLSFLILTQ